VSDTIDRAPPSRRGGRGFGPQGPTRRRVKPVEQRSSLRPTLVKPPDLRAAKNGPCPGCRNFDRCTALVICCEAFALFARVGNDYNAERWKWAPHQPSAAIMERLVGSARQSKLERRRAHEAASAELQRPDAEF
jgi:hypothetical protein